MKLACSFFSYLSILYQRGIYPAECFKREQHYDLTLFTCDNKELQEYLSSVLKQLKGKMIANKTIEFMFVGINMFWAQLRLILARAIRRGLN